MLKSPFVTVLVLLLLGGSAKAQTELGTPFLDYSWQSGISNPAWMPKHTFTLGLPGFHNDFSFTNLTINDLLRANRSGQLEIDQLLDKLKADNFIREQLDVRSIYLGYASDRFSVHFTHGLRFNLFFAYPKTFPELLAKGNAAYIGQEVDITPDFQASAYQEMALGFAFRLNEQWQFGVRGKLLSGWTDVSVASGKKGLRILTSDDVYQLNMLADYRINHTGHVAYDGLGNFDFEPVPDNSGGNQGWAIDLGATYNLDPFTFSAGVLDLGQISWTQEVGNLTLDGAYTYEGLDVVGSLLENDTEDIAILDSLDAEFDFVDTYESYTTALPTRLYASGRMKLDDRYSVGLFYVHEVYRGYHFPYVAVSANGSFGRVLDAGLLIGYKHGKLGNIGANMLLKLGPVQLLAASDNLLGILFPTHSSTANVRLGLNLVFGRKESPAIAQKSRAMKAEDFF